MIRLIFTLVMLAVIVGLLVSTIDLRQVGAALAGADYSLLPVMLGLRILPVLSRSYRMAILLDRIRRIIPIYHAEATCYLLNSVLPFRAGDLAVMVLLPQSLGMHVTRVVAATTLDRLLDVASGLLILLAIIPLLPDLPDLVQNGMAVLAALAAAAMAVMGLALHRREEILRWAQAWLHRRLPATADLWLARIDEGLAGINMLRSPSRIAAALGLTLLSWAMAVASLYVTALGFGVDAGWLPAILGVCATSLGSVVITVPSGVGVAHAVVTVAYVLCGVPESTALAIAVVGHLVSLCASVLGGAASLHLSGLHFAAVFRQSLKRAFGPPAAPAPEAASER